MFGNPISWADLVNFTDNKDIKGAVRDLQKLTDVYEKFAKTVTDGSLARFNEMQQEIVESVRALVAASKDLNITQKQGQKLLLENAQQLQGYDAMLKQLAETKKKVKVVDDSIADSVNGLNKQLREQIEEYNTLSKAEALHSERGKKLALDIQTTRREIKLLTDATKASTQTFQAAKGSYDALDRETKQLVKDLRALEAGMSGTNKQAEQMKKQIADNTRRLKEFDRELGQNFRNVGNYGSAFGNLTGQLRAFTLGLVSVTALTQGVAAAFNKSLGFDSVKRSIEFVSGSAIEFDKNLRFLRNTADELGLDFEGLTIGFKNFAAATKDTNLEGDQTRRIFRAVSEAAAVLKISTEDVNGVLRALGQVVSKGKLQAEELRGQLGDRLSGAFQLFAKGLGVTTAQLDEFLKKGQITADALIPFAAQLEKTFGPGVAGNVNSLQSAVNRLGNTFDTLFQGSELNKFFTNIVTGANDALKAILGLERETQRLAVAAKKEATDAQALVAEYEKLSAQVDKTAEQKDRLNNIVALLTAQFGNSVVEINKETGALELNIAATKDLITQKLLLANDAAAEAAARYRKAINEEKTALDNVTISQLNYNNAVKANGGVGAEAIGDKITNQTVNPRLPSTGGTFVGTLSDQETAILKLRVATKGYTDQATEAGKEAEKYRKKLEELGFTIKDIDKLLNPETTTTTVNPFGPGKDNGKAAREAQRRIKSAQDVLKATEQLLIEQAKLEYEQGQHTVERQIELERKIYAIRVDSIEKQKKLFGKNTDDYIKLQKDEVDATKDKLQKIDKLIEENAKRQEKRRDDLERRLKERRAAQRDVSSAQAEGAFIDDSAAIDLELATRKGNFMTSGGNDEFAAYEAQYRLRQRALSDTLRLRQQDLADLKLKLGEAADLDKEYLDKKKQLIEAENALKKESADFGIAQAQREAESKQALYDAALTFANNIADNFFEKNIQRAKDETATLQDQKQRELAIVGNNATAKAKIEDGYARQLRAARRKEAQAQKDAAIFNASINTIAGAVRALVDYSFPYNLIVAGIVAATGAAQIANISSTELPQYWKGRDNGPEELARVNEKGFEFIERDGRLLVAGRGKETITKLEAGDKVHTHEKSLGILAKSQGKNADAVDFMSSLLDGTGVILNTNEKQTDRLIHAYAANSLSEGTLSRAFQKAVENITIEQSVFDERGYSRYNKKKNSRIQDMNTRNKIGGRG